MRIPQSSTGGRPARFGRWIGAITLGLLAGGAGGGCVTEQARPSTTLSRAEQMGLQNRALELLLRAAHSADPFVACNAIEALADVAPRDGRPAFRRAVRAPDPLVRYAGFVASGVLRDCEVMAAAKEGVHDSHPNVRLAAAFCAYRCGKEGAARILVQALTGAPQESIRADAATLLGRLDEPRAVAWLRRAARSAANQKSTRVRLQIHGALARLGDEDGLRQLVIYSHGDTAARIEALLLLAQLDHQQARDDLLYALLGPEEDYLEARLVAARGLGKLGYHEGFDLALQSLTYTDPNPNPAPDDPDQTFAVRSLAAHALAAIGDPRALPALRDVAADPSDPRLQVAASYAICKILSR